MRIDILTLFPAMFTPFLEESIIKRAIEKGLVTFNIINFRDFTTDPHHKVDDTPYDALESVRTSSSKVILLTPGGTTYNQKKAKSLSLEKHLIIICGHYEGFDDRIKLFVDEEISIGDFVLTGGEIPAMAISDSIVRLLDGVINKESLLNESFEDNLLDYPNYTKPRNFRGYEVPSVLLSGDHEKIALYRKSEQERLTKEKREDLLH